MRRYFKAERSQSMVEFALIAPILFVIIFGIIDFGRGLYYYIAIQNAANEGGRVAVQGFPFGGLVQPYLPPDSEQVIKAVVTDTTAVTLCKWSDETTFNARCSVTNGSTSSGGAVLCRNGPVAQNNGGTAIDTAAIAVPANQGYVFVTDSEPTGATLPNGSNKAPPAPNAPGGESSSFTPPNNCYTIRNGGSNSPLQVTVIYHFVPLTERFLEGTLHLTGGALNLNFVAYSVYATDY